MTSLTPASGAVHCNSCSSACQEKPLALYNCVGCLWTLQGKCFVWIERSSCFSFSCAKRVATLSAVRDLNSRLKRQLIEESAVFFWCRGPDHKGIPRRYSQPRPPEPPSTSTASPWHQIFMPCHHRQWLPLIIADHSQPSVISCMVLKPCFRRSFQFGVAALEMVQRKYIEANCKTIIFHPRSKHPSFDFSPSVSHQWPAVHEHLIVAQIVLQRTSKRCSLLTLPFFLVHSVTSPS